MGNRPLSVRCCEAQTLASNRRERTAHEFRSLAPISFVPQHREGGIARAIPFQDRGRGTPTERRTTTFFHALIANKFAGAHFIDRRSYDAGMSLASDLPPRRGVVAVVMRGEQFLVIRRSQHVRAPGMHCFPGGAIEPAESEDQAVVREMLEELSLAARPTRLLWRSVTPWNVELAWWLVEVQAMAEPIANPLEVEAFHWLTAAEMRCLPQLLASNLEFLDAWESGQIARDTISRGSAD